MTVDLLIIGLVLSDISGFEVISALRKRGAGADLPILVLSDRTVGENDKQRLNGQVLRIMEKAALTANNSCSRFVVLCSSAAAGRCA